MIPNNNFSVLPWYTSIQQQNARKWWIYNKIYPLFTPAGFILPFQIAVQGSAELGEVYLHNANTNVQIANITEQMLNTGYTVKHFPSLGYNVAVYPGILPAFTTMENGRYYLRAGVGYSFYYSEVFTVVNDIQPYVKITWWDVADFVMDSGIIVYTSPNFKNVIYLQADIAKPEYPFEEEGEMRDGYFFPIKQISEKRYRFKFFASEYILDVMRLIRMADYAEIEFNGQRYSLDTFLLTPEWESEGDVASVEAVFDTATVAKKTGLGYIKAQRGDFNDDFNNDFNNQ